MRILIAEDDFTSRTMLAAILKKWGYEPVVAVEGKSALKALSGDDAPKLALLDWSMPGMDGLEVCRRLRKLPTSEPPYIIFLTSRGDKNCIVEALEAGANDYVIKPYDNAELRARIRVGQRMAEMQSAMNEAKEAVLHEAMHDPLTGILNRRAILDVLRKEIFRSDRSGIPFSIGLCDIDRFKRVNDRYGHQTGDDVLCGFVRAVEGELRAYDRIGRYGGEEFLVVAPDSSGEGAERLFERVREAVALKGIETRSGLVPVTVSIGVVSGRGDSDVDALLAAADDALYRAKNTGRNRVVCLGEIPGAHDSGAP